MSELSLKVLQSANLSDFITNLRNSNCKACTLGSCYPINKPVVSRGSLDAKIMLVGEAPGETENEKGFPFTGRAGQLLDELLGQLGLTTQKDCYISNIARCRPSNNRVPTMEEAKLCSTYLKHEISLLKPKIVVCLGKTAAQYLIPSIKSSAVMKSIVGTFYREIPDYLGTIFMVTYHPAFLLRPNGQPHKEEFIQHFTTMMATLGIQKEQVVKKEYFSIKAPERIQDQIWIK